MNLKKKLSYLLLCILMMAIMVTVGAIVISADTTTTLGSGEYDGRYGALPETFDSSQTPFAVFQNNEYKGSYADWVNNGGAPKTKTPGGALYAAITLANATPDSPVNVVMLDDYVAPESNFRYQYVATLKGTVEADFWGHSFTAGKSDMFEAIARTAGAETSIKISNGKLLLKNSAILKLQAYQGKNQKLNFEFSDLEIGFADGATVKKFVYTAGVYASCTGPVTSEVVFNNCIFNLKADTVPFDFTNADPNLSLDIKINGGIFKNDSENNLALVNTLDDNDSFTIGAYNGAYPSAILPADATAPTASYTMSDGSSFTYSESSVDEVNGTKTYTLVKNSYIPGYGTIPNEYDDSEKYPFVVFQNGVFKGAFSMLGNSKSGDGDKTTEAFAYLKTIMTNNSAEADLLLRRDYDCEGYGIVGNFTKALGTINIDLLGNTLTAGAYSFIQIGVRTAGGALTFNVKDGEVLLDNQGANLVKVLSEDAADTKGTVTFTNVKIGYASGATSAKTNIVETGNSTKTSVSHTDIIFTDCHFDFVTNAPTKNKVLLNLTGNGASHTMNVTINGGSITVSDYSKFTMANLTEGKDTLTMGKGSDGKYLTVNTNSGTAAPSGSYNNGTLAFVKVNATDKTTTYELATSSIKSYVPKMSLTLDSNLIANVYIPVNGTQSFTLDGLSSADIADLEEKQVDIDGVWYYLVPVELAANEAAKDILLNVTVLFGDKTAKGTFTFSIVKYAQKVIADGNTLEVTLVKDVLAYVNAAYSYFNGETVSAIDTILNGYKGTLTVEGSADVPTEGIVGATFVLDATPSIKLYLPADTDVSAYTFSEGGRALEYTTGTETLNVDGVDVECVYVEIAVYAYRMCEAITYTNGKVSGSYHINAYYEFAKNDAELASLVESFWIYCQSARAYKTEATK